MVPSDGKVIPAVAVEGVTLGVDCVCDGAAVLMIASPLVGGVTVATLAAAGAPASRGHPA
jgi:hypothetical protein